MINQWRFPSMRVKWTSFVIDTTIAVKVIRWGMQKKGSLTEVWQKPTLYLLVTAVRDGEDQWFGSEYTEICTISVCPVFDAQFTFP